MNRSKTYCPPSTTSHLTINNSYRSRVEDNTNVPLGSSSRITTSGSTLLSKDSAATERARWGGVLDADYTNIFHASHSTGAGHSSRHLHLDGEISCRRA